MDAEDDVSGLLAEAVSAGKTGVLFLGLFAAQDASSTRVSIDERYPPTLRWERHGRVSTGKQLDVGQAPELFQRFTQSWHYPRPRVCPELSLRECSADSTPCPGILDAVEVAADVNPHA